jgi:prepilin-type N-terminal cleavage/methylation domain-containing protein
VALNLLFLGRHEAQERFLQMNTSMRRQSGFTLVELSVVLVVTGLLIGGLVKGQELVNLTKVKGLEAEFRSIQTFIYTYQDKYAAIPGDDWDAATHVGGVTASTPAGVQGNGIVNGAWNSTIPTDEAFLFWQHIRLDRLAMGSTDIGDAHYLPINAVGGRIGVQGLTTNASDTPIFAGPGQASPIRGTYIICSAGIPGKFVTRMESDMDDGDTAGGAMMATPTSGYGIGLAVATAKGDIVEDQIYTVCMGI